MLAKNILVADEDADTRVILRTLLERQQFTVIEAESADAALAASRQWALDLVIMNYPMLCASGDTLVRRLKNDSLTRDVPILNLTSRVVPQYLTQAASEGVDITLPKPLDVEQIVTVVSDLISRHQPMASL